MSSRVDHVFRSGRIGFNSRWVSTEQRTQKPHQLWLNRYGLWHGTDKQELILRKTHTYTVRCNATSSRFTALPPSSQSL